MNENDFLSVSMLTRYISQLFESDDFLSQVAVKGEITNFKYNISSGHCYFTLKDAETQISCVMFRSNFSRISFRPENGNSVLIFGSVKLYSKNGTYQLYCDQMLLWGKGALWEQYLKLKEKLEKEGLFDPSRKMPVPAFPKCVGIITSSSGAAYHDIIKNLKERLPTVNVVFRPAIVQGPEAPADLCDAMNDLINDGTADVIIIGRGGGSFEDLFAFNDESLARIIASSPIPVISAVGHESDSSICDFAADVIASTPTLAAVLAVPKGAELISEMDSLIDRCRDLLTGKIFYYRRTVNTIASLSIFRSSDGFLRERMLNLDHVAELLNSRTDSLIKSKSSLLEKYAASLSACNPRSVLSRGYAIITKNGEDVNSVNKVSMHDKVDILLADGSLSANIIEINGDC